jgi:hypothetical protein
MRFRSGWDSDDEDCSRPSFSWKTPLESVSCVENSLSSAVSVMLHVEISGQVPHQEVIDLTSNDEDSSSQRALQRDWPSDEDMSFSC